MFLGSWLICSLSSSYVVDCKIERERASILIGLCYRYQASKHILTDHDTNT